MTDRSCLGTDSPAFGGIYPRVLETMLTLTHTASFGGSPPRLCPLPPRALVSGCSREEGSRAPQSPKPPAGWIYNISLWSLFAHISR